MKNETRKKLDNIQSKERRKRLIYIIFTVILFLIIAAVFVPVNTEIAYGTTKGYTDKHTETGASAVVTVALTSGEVVLADFPKNTAYINNTNVELTIQYSLLNFKTYRVVNYVK